MQEDTHQGKMIEAAEPELLTINAAELAAILESSNDAIIGKNLHGMITSWNAGAEKVFGYAASEMLGHSIMELIPPKQGEEEAAIIDQIKRGENVLHFETVRVRKGGSPIEVSVTVSAIRDPAGKIIGASKVARDITEWKRQERELQRTHEALARSDRELVFQATEKALRADELAVIVEERTAANKELAFQVEEKAKRADELAAMNAHLIRANLALERSNVDLAQFAYIASHDLQTPLRNISGFMQLLRQHYADKLDARADDWIRRTIEAAGRMHTLIQDVLAYSRVDSRIRPFHLVSLREVFQDAAGLLESGIRDTKAEVTCDDELPSVRGDRPQLVQLLQNLMGNGLKYHSEKPPRIHVSARREGEEWTISVSDNGIGIAPRHQDRIFEIFKRLHNQQEYPGTGIGLAICRRVAHHHGGKIWVESEEGCGSVFKFTIPESL